ncbi:Uncharacterized protein T10_3602 [Trichinella papuae]|uniref:Reverse transcriptase domain-containing protein n=1 Tax=Trichinella papuae TaxID=268474 RepID=A0A0V1N7J7_9BILA|nr:Uncharacterized protein T10_3602 [Trichinella papuae]
MGFEFTSLRAINGPLQELDGEQHHPNNEFTVLNNLVNTTTDMKTITHFEEFDISNPAGWEEYSERLVFFLEANSIREGPRRLAVLCSVCGTKTYRIIKSLTSPDPPSSKTFDEVMMLLRNHFMPRLSEVYQRFLYQRRLQQPGEGVVAYVTELRHLAQHCNFGETLESRLRDQLVCGLRDRDLQKQLLTDGELTFAKAFERALSAEAATSQVSDIPATNPAATTEEQLVTQKKSDRNSSMRNIGRQQESPQPQSLKPCYRCGGAHAQNICRFKNVSCNFCKRLGHIERVCRAKSQSTVKKGAAKPNRDRNLAVSRRLRYTKQCCHPNACGLKSILDHHLGAYIQTCLSPLSTPSRTFPLITERLPKGRSRGIRCDPVKFSSFTGSLPVVVVKGPRRTLLGRNWFKPLAIRLAGVHSVAPTRSVQDLIEEYAEFFSDTLDTVKGPPVVLHTDGSIPPIQMNARRDLDRFVEQSILEPVQHMAWTTPIVPDLYQIPAVNDILATLKKGRIFAKLGLAQAYQQQEVDEASAELQTIITHKGAFKAKRLQFGIASAPGIFQRFMDSLLANLDGVVPYFDDMLIVADSQHELLEVLRRVFDRLRNAGIRLNREKCVFVSNSVEFVGYRIDAEGIHPSEEKVEAIHKAPRPKNKQELTSVLGFAQYDYQLPNNTEIAKRKVTPPHREFKVDDHVFVRCYNQQNKLAKAKIVKRIGRLLYIVRTEIGLIWKRHADQIRPREIK